VREDDDGSPGYLQVGGRAELRPTVPVEQRTKGVKLVLYDPGMGEPGVRVGPIREGDYERVLPLIAGYQRFYQAEPDEARNRPFFRRFLEPSDDGLLLGAWVGDELAGFATLYWTFSSTHAAEVALMNDLFVDERHRSAGVGLALIRASVEEARRRRMRHLEWLTADDNERAQRLYERTGAERSAWFGYEIRIR
jgi:GNAT superfamily N-acetyltransferase